MWYKFSISNMHHIMNPDYVGDQNYENLLSAFIKDYGIHKGGLPDRDPKGKSMWLLKDGSVIDLGQLYHMMAYKKLLADHKLNPITNGHEPSEYDDENYFTPDSFELYRNFGIGTGAIRLYHNGYPGSTSHMYCVISYPPTSEQMQILKQIGNFYEGTYSDWSSNVNFNFKTYDELESRLNQKGLIDSYPNRKKEDINEPQKPDSPIENKMQSFLQNVDRDPIIPSLERKRLFENYPGNENSKLRSLYERSASIKTSQISSTEENIVLDQETLNRLNKLIKLTEGNLTQEKILADANVFSFIKLYLNPAINPITLLSSGPLQEYINKNKPNVHLEKIKQIDQLINIPNEYKSNFDRKISKLIELTNGGLTTEKILNDAKTINELHYYLSQKTVTSNIGFLEKYIINNTKRTTTDKQNNNIIENNWPLSEVYSFDELYTSDKLIKSICIQIISINNPELLETVSTSKFWDFVLSDTRNKFYLVKSLSSKNTLFLYQLIEKYNQNFKSEVYKLTPQNLLNLINNIAGVDIKDAGLILKALKDPEVKDKLRNIYATPNGMEEFINSILKALNIQKNIVPKELDFDLNNVHNVEHIPLLIENLKLVIDKSKKDENYKKLLSEKITLLLDKINENIKNSFLDQINKNTNIKDIKALLNLIPYLIREKLLDDSHINKYKSLLYKNFNENINPIELSNFTESLFFNNMSYSDYKSLLKLEFKVKDEKGTESNFYLDIEDIYDNNTHKIAYSYIANLPENEKKYLMMILNNPNEEILKSKIHSRAMGLLTNTNSINYLDCKSIIKNFEDSDYVKQNKHLNLLDRSLSQMTQRYKNLDNIPDNFKAKEKQLNTLCINKLLKEQNINPLTDDELDKQIDISDKNQVKDLSDKITNMGLKLRLYRVLSNEDWKKIKQNKTLDLGYGYLKDKGFGRQKEISQEYYLNSKTGLTSTYFTPTIENISKYMTSKSRSGGGANIGVAYIPIQNLVESSILLGTENYKNWERVHNARNEDPEIRSMYYADPPKSLREALIRIFSLNNARELLSYIPVDSSEYKALFEINNKSEESKKMIQQETNTYKISKRKFNYNEYN